MRIGFDIRPFLKEETGVGVYFKNLLFYLSEIDQDNEYFLFSSSLKDRFLPTNVPPFVKLNFCDFHFPVKAVNFFWYKTGWPPLDYFFRTRLDLTHSPTPLILPTRGKKIVTVYDLFFMDYPNMADRLAKRNFFNKIEYSVHEADSIVTISMFTKKRLQERFDIESSKIKVIYLGIDRDVWKEISEEDLERVRSIYNLPSSFLLFVGALEPRKNLLNLVEALKIVHEKFEAIPLVLVGRKGQDYKNVMERIRKFKLESWVSWVGYVEGKELKSFYRLASLFVLPSLCEGFGLPLLEAMACQVPIVISKTSALPEIAQDAAIYFDPHKPEDIAEKIILALQDEDLKERLVAKGEKRVLDFDWRATARGTLKLYQSIAT